jgi:Virulence factor
MPTLIVIHWRDIPSQVTAREGRTNAKAMLPLRFQAAIDKAATVAGKKNMDEYLAEWRRVERPCGADLEAEVAAEVARIEAEYGKERLRALVTNRGYESAPANDTEPTASPAPDPTEAS